MIILGMLREFLSQHELRCATPSKLVDQLIVQLVQDGFVRFLGRKCFIQPLLSSDFSIDLCFDDMLEKQGFGLKKPHMHINTEYFD